MDIQANRFQNKKSTQIAYFSPYKGHIHNPAMGIICMAISDHMVKGYTPESREKSDLEPCFSVSKEMLAEVISLGYIDNIYIRVGWCDVQQEQGKLEFSKQLTDTLQVIEQHKIPWGLRIMHTSPSNPQEHLMPRFLEKVLPTVSYYDKAYGNTAKILPLYTDDFLLYWGEMLTLLGKRFDNDPLLEYVDVSGYGLWGEGHHGCCKTLNGKVEDLYIHSPQTAERVVRTLIQSHQKAFPTTPMVLNLIWADYEAGREAIAKGCWVRRDSYHHWFEAHQAEYGLLRPHNSAMIFETVMPGIAVQDSLDKAFCYHYSQTPDKMCEYGASYGIIGFNPLDTLYAAHVEPQLFETFKNKLGYRLRPSIVWKIEHNDNAISLALGMVNDGCSNPSGDVIFIATSANATSEVVVNGGNFSSRMYIVEIPLPIGHDNVVEISAMLQYGGKRAPMRFAASTGEQSAPLKLVLQLKH